MRSKKKKLFAKRAFNISAIKPPRKLPFANQAPHRPANDNPYHASSATMRSGTDKTASLHRSQINPLFCKNAAELASLGKTRYIFFFFFSFSIPVSISLQPFVSRCSCWRDDTLWIIFHRLGVRLSRHGVP